MKRAAIFDLDETLLDTGMLAAARREGDWGSVANRLGEAKAYRDETSSVQALDLPGLAAKQGMKVGVLTASPNHIANALLDQFEIPFDRMIGGSDKYPSKPDPQSLEALIAQLGVKPDECLMIGDAPTDFGAAGNGGVRSIGVAWGGLPPADWARDWPDVAVCTPDEALRAFSEAKAMMPIAEVLAEGEAPIAHWGSLIARDPRTFAAGRYMATTDRRQADHELSKLILRAKDDTDEAERVAAIFAEIVPLFDFLETDLIASVPKRPDQEYDRFATVRPVVAESVDGEDAGELLEMVEVCDNYKELDHDARREANEDRFESTEELEGESVLLIDDVVTSGGQSRACTQALLGAGAGEVWVLALAATQNALRRRCPACETGTMTRIVGSRGPFLGCSNYFYTRCPYTEDLDD